MPTFNSLEEKNRVSGRKMLSAYMCDWEYSDHLVTKHAQSQSLRIEDKRSYLITPDSFCA